MEQTSDHESFASVPISIRGVSKAFFREEGPLEVLQDVSLDIARGEFVALLGPSGCGKSTLLRLIAGLDLEYSGEIRVHGRPVRGTRREIGIVFQEPRLLPWLTVERNVAFGLRDVSRREAIAQARTYVERVGLAGFEQALPKELSGGMAQRAALARALARRPEVLLLDEPFGALDALTRMRLQDSLLDIWSRHRVSVLLVTHDIDEALYLSDRVAVMSARPGRIRKTLDIPLKRPRDRAGAGLEGLRRDIMAELGVIS